MNELALFAGVGGGILASKLLGWKTVCAVEIEPFCIERLMQRQNEGHLEPFPIWDDIRTFDGRSWRGVVDVVSGGFPCQDISCAGRGIGIDGKRSGLWYEMARIISEIRPKHVFVENSPMLIIRGLDRVLRDLAEMGYNAKWGVLGAGHIGAWHLRERIWLVATDNMQKRIQRFRKKKIFKKPRIPWSEDVRSVEDIRKRSDIPQPVIWRNGNGMADYVERISAIGNGQVPQVAKLAWELLS